MRLKEYFADVNTETSTPSTQNKYKKSTFTPEYGRDRTLDNYLQTLENTVNNIQEKRVRSNLTQEETEALDTLRRNQDIVIFPADKGGALVILEKKFVY